MTSKHFHPASFISLWLVVICIVACRKEPEIVQQEEAAPATAARFTLMSPDQTGVAFTNHIREDYNINIFNFEYLYNGCGVAAGDVNGDGLPDLYFSSSFRANKLYLNLGNMKFQDVTALAGVGAEDGFKTGVAMADVNGDGLLDIYSCRTSKDNDGKKTDFLYINKGNKNRNGIDIPIFEEQGKALGIDDNSNTNHVCFLDFDRDGDLDVFLLNHRLNFSESTKVRLKQEEDGSMTRITTPETPFESNRLYKNDKGHFTDITGKAGLISSAFGLSAIACDINEDGWLDIYVGNDYIEPDYIYINNKNGTFTDRSARYLKHSAQHSMGADISDINNDGLVDIMVLDMKAEDHIRYKELMHVMTYDRYNLLVQYGYGRQVGRNVLQLNAGNQTFNEIGQYAGVAATDWSWGAIMADFDNDGWKDIYVSNGYRKDVTNYDYTNYFRDSIKQLGGITPDRFPTIQDFMKYLPEQKINNYLYINSGQLSFINATQQAGMDHPSYSNGAAYADLDQDGDLDLIVNNIEEPAFIYRNDITQRNWIQVDLETGNGNKDGFGSSADIYAGGVHQLFTLIGNRGYYSSSEPIIHVGLGTATKVDSIILTWPNGDKEIMQNVDANQRIQWKKGTHKKYTAKPASHSKPLFTSSPKINWVHQENDFVDFKREKMLPYMISAEGPCLAVGDVNGDQLEDVYAGNGAGFPKALLTQQANGTFIHADIPAFGNDAVYEDCGALLEDMDGDKDLDLVVISGGNSFNANEAEYMTRYYSNDGKGSFSRSNNFPIIRTNAGAVLAVDLDQDNDKDLLIGGRCSPGNFPKPPKSYFLINNQGNFQDATTSIFPEFELLGMITDMEAADLDGDGKTEIVVAGEWMPLSVFSYDGKKMTNKTKDYGLDATSGWWKSIHMADIDSDGDQDLLAGNMGLNHRLKTSAQYPITLISNDFDGNGSIDPIMCYYDHGKLYPFAGRDPIIAQIPMLKKKFIRYGPYARATIQDIFKEDQLEKSSYLYVNTFQTQVYRNDQNKFTSVSLPYQVQLSPVFDIMVKDFNHDGRQDILMAGNFLYSETETGEMDAGNGTLLLQQADGSFHYVPNTEHGFWAQGEVRELKSIKVSTEGKDAILTGNNRGPIEMSIIVN